MQARFARLEEMRRQIDAQPVEGQTWYREVLRKLDYLLEKFLQFASKEAQFRCYLQSLQEELQGAAPPGAARFDDFGFRREDNRRTHRSRGRASTTGAGAEFDLASGGSLPVDGDDRWVEQTTASVQAHYDAEMAELRQQMEREQD